MVRLSFDIEGNDFLEGLTTIWCIVTEDLETGEVRRYNNQGTGSGTISDGLAALQAADELYPHNGEGYDYPAIEKVTGVTFPRSKMRDTLVMARLANPDLRGGHSIAAWGERQGAPKGDHSDFSKWSVEQEDYCEVDTHIAATLGRKLLKEFETWSDGRHPRRDGMPLYLWIEHWTARLIALQMQTGFPFDIRAATELAAVYWEEKERLKLDVLKSFPPKWKAGKVFVPKKDNKAAGYVAGAPFTRIELQDFNPDSPAQVGERLMGLGWKPTQFTDGGQPKVDDEVLGSLPYPEAKVLARYAKAEKKWGQIAAAPTKKSAGGWIHCCKADGRVYGYVNSCGAVTGRMTHSRPNTANIDKDPAMRALWLAAPGKKLVGCDAEGLEARMMAHYLHPLDGGAYTTAIVSGDKTLGTDAHSRNRKVARMYSRDNVKTVLYAMIFGAGDAKLGTEVFSDARAADKLNPKDSPWFYTGNGKLKTRSAVGKEVRALLEQGITGFGKLSSGIKGAIQRNGHLIGVDGRRLNIRSLHSSLNSLFQGGGAIVMKLALILAHMRYVELGWKYRDDWEYHANVHDEVQMSVRPELAAQAGEIFADSIREAGVQLGIRCPLAGAYEIGDNWSQTH